MSDPDSALPQRFIDDFEATLDRLATAPSFSKFTHQIQLLARAQKLLRNAAGVAALYRRAPDFDAAGVFLGGDWLDPAQLEPALAGGALRAGGADANMESLSELRLLAMAEGRLSHPALDADAARVFLCEVLAANLDLVFPVATEATREDPALGRAHVLCAFLFARIGASAIIDALIVEIERVMAQRPIVINRVATLLDAAERAIAADDVNAETGAQASAWIAARRAPSPLAAAAAHPHGYRAALADKDAQWLADEAAIMARSMDRHGLVAPVHAELVRHLARAAPDTLPDALALDSTGRVAFDRHRTAITRYIDAAVTPNTARAVYAISRLLNAGDERLTAVIPGLDRLLDTPLHPAIVAAIESSDVADTLPAATRLFAATLAVLGQPRGVDQGHNPTCQAARAICLWSCNDPAHLLNLIATVTRDDDLILDFEGRPIRSSSTAEGMAKTLHPELDPVSRILTPHLDRIYVEMGRCTVGRAGDGHRWVNREMHGAWVAPDFAELIDLTTGAITRADAFIRLFHAAYHPAYNGGRRLDCAQPCGIAATDATGAYIGWHAVAIQRVARDPAGIWRLYFFNPNRDKGQNWGQGIQTSTHGHGELEGESSLPFGQFASRLYVFHYDATAIGDVSAPAAAEIADIRQLITASWGRRFAWLD